MSKTTIDPVHEAVMRHSLSDLTQALAQDNDVDALDREGRTALFYAIRDGNPAIFTELIRHGTQVNVQDSAGKTPLHFAAIWHQPELAELLLKNGANVNAQDAQGNSPLSDAVFYSKGRGEVIKVLLAHGAVKTLKNKHGSSPESLANSIGNYDISQFLL